MLPSPPLCARVAGRCFVRLARARDAAERLLALAVFESELPPSHCATTSGACGGRFDFNWRRISRIGIAMIIILLVKGYSLNGFDTRSAAQVSGQLVNASSFRASF